MTTSARVTHVTLAEYEDECERPRWSDGKLLYVVIALMALVLVALS